MIGHNSSVSLGEGIFETILVRKRRIFKLDEHIDRLFASARAFHQEIPLDKVSLKEKILKEARESLFRDIYLRVAVSNAQVSIIAKEFIPYPERDSRQGIRAAVVPTRRSHPEITNPRTKNQNFLSNILARTEAISRNLPEGLMCDQGGFLTEGTISNLFIVRDGILKTPPGINILKGITRGVVMDLALAAGTYCCEEMLTPYDLYTADEAFLTYTSAGIVPVVEADGRTIGNGFPGPLTRRLIELYEETFWAEARPIDRA